MINKRVKEEIKKYHKPNIKIRFGLGTIAIVSVCLLILVIATFTQIKISFNVPDGGIISYLKFEYIPQIPAVLFIAALLGEYWGLFTLILYILLGLTPWYPVFALGGGLSYIFQYNFGYIFAFIFAIIFTAKELKNSKSLLNIILAVFYGVFSIHLIGILYMIIIALIRHDNWEFIGQWIYFQSLVKILYDIVFGFLAIIIAKNIRKLLWLVLG